ncbi:hypothetical protein B0I29_11727 [Actinoplanes lutulentus]|uniref:Uncharacterized protein n=1 Tax=Actinoplanes lutulentus TaxID=1287878 RepID=A0A327Z3B1_9ACTN|nr:hypothetical protein B0I29_11727 [Actinoplanes lutulentus]
MIDRIIIHCAAEVGEVTNIRHLLISLPIGIRLIVRHVQIILEITGDTIGTVKRVEAEACRISVRESTQDRIQRNRHYIYGPFLIPHEGILIGFIRQQGAKRRQHRACVPGTTPRSLLESDPNGFIHYTTGFIEGVDFQINIENHAYPVKRSGPCRTTLSRAQLLNERPHRVVIE